MYNTNDDVLISSRPKSLSEDIYKEYIENIIFNSNYHLDELLEIDKEKVQKEVSEYIRPKNKSDSDKYVIHIYDKS